MTEENYNYRTSGLFLRNQFKGDGEFNIPIIPKSNFTDSELKNLLLIGFDKTKSDENNFDRIVHFFLYDYTFENIWNKPDNYVNKLKKYIGVLSPDFSMYLEMNRTLQLYNTFRNRWCGAYLASKGIKVIPTVSWGDETTYKFCFDGIPKGSIVAVSTYMVREHNNHSDQKEFFMKGYNEMLNRIQPSKIICYSEPFMEMRGNIIYVDYELSGWRYLKGSKQILNDNTKGGRIIYKTMLQPEGFPMPLCNKGMGSAYGGKWKPKKPEDERFFGEPNTIKTFYFKYRIDVKYGSNCKGIIERHYTNHGRDDKHSNPHDHYITWDTLDGHPEVKGPTNYWGDIPEFKSFCRGDKLLMKTIRKNTEEENRFKTISEFKWCLGCGGEIEFEWKGKSYSITHPDGRINIGEGYYRKGGKCFNILNHEECFDIEGLWGDTADEILEYNVGGDRLREIITQVTVLARTI